MVTGPGSPADRSDPLSPHIQVLRIDTIQAFHIQAIFTSVGITQRGCLSASYLHGHIGTIASSAQLPTPASTIEFWFAPAMQEKWFTETPEIDAHIRETYGPLVVAARSPGFEALPQEWNACKINSSSVEALQGDKESEGRVGGTASAEEKADEGELEVEARTNLALIILLDQFSRNIYRGSGESFAGDAKAAEVAAKSIAKGLDRRVGHMQAFFFYIPFMHAESLSLQQRGVKLIEEWRDRCDGVVATSQYKKEREEAELAARAARHSVGFARGHARTVEEFGRFPARNGPLGRECTGEELKFLKEHKMGFYMNGKEKDKE